LPTLLPVSLSPSPISSPPSYNIISQHNLNVIIRQQQEQLAAMQAQIQALLAGGVVVKRAEKSGAVSTEVTRPQIFNGTSSKVSEFVTACRLYIRMKMREVAVEKQI